MHRLMLYSKLPVASIIGQGPVKQTGSPSSHGHNPSARLQAARSFFTSPRAAGCKAGHPQAVLQGLVQALHQLPADLNQGQHRNADDQSLPATVLHQTFSALNKVCWHDRPVFRQYKP